MRLKLLHLQSPLCMLGQSKLSVTFTGVVTDIRGREATVKIIIVVYFSLGNEFCIIVRREPKNRVVRSCC